MVMSYCTTHPVIIFSYLIRAIGAIPCPFLQILYLVCRLCLSDSEMLLCLTNELILKKLQNMKVLDYKIFVQVVFDAEGLQGTS